MTFDDYIRQYGHKEEALASALGVSQAAINQWRRGKRMPRAVHIHRISELSGGEVTLADWFTPPDAQADA
jgi:transcriptional regulator with XRE-family HTH domain